MNRSTKFAALALGTLAIGVAAFLNRDHIQQMIDPTDGALAACEENLKAQLKSPSSYKRLEYKHFFNDNGFSIDAFKQYNKTHDVTSDPEMGHWRNLADQRIDQMAMEITFHKPYAKITMAEREKYEQDLLKRDFEVFKYGRSSERTAKVFITYEADNSYGASLKDIHECNFAPMKSEAGRYTQGELFSYDTTDG